MAENIVLTNEIMSVYSKCFDTLLSDYSLKYNKSIVTENYDGLLDSIIQKSPGAILKGLKFYFPIYFVSGMRVVKYDLF